MKKLIIILFIILLILSSLSLYISIKNIPQSIVLNNFGFNKIDKNTSCSNLSLLNTSECLRNELKTFYKYNYSEVHSDYNLSRIKIYGGVCWHYAKWYSEKIKQLNNFYYQEVHIEISEKYAHNFTIISNEEGYCILDQINIYCNKLIFE